MIYGFESFENLSYLSHHQLGASISLEPDATIRQALRAGAKEAVSDGAKYAVLVLMGLLVLAVVPSRTIRSIKRKLK